jgi:ABC-type lipoprotein export system ATPase subunit
MVTPAPFVVAKGLCKRFEGAERDVLSAVDLSLHAGDHLAIVGRSGSGKSTLLYLLGLLDQATDGELLWDGAATSALSEDALAQRRRDEIGFIFQDHHLLPQCSALDNVLVPLLATQWRTTSAQKQRATELLERLGLGDRLQHRPHQLSTGQRQRVAVARALMGEPRLLLADEPTGALDTESARQLMALLAEHGRGIAMVVVTHDLVLAEQVGRVHRLEDGRLVAT